MKGTYFEGTFTSRVIKPNMSARYKIFVPECEGELGLVFSHDGFNVQEYYINIFEPIYPDPNKSITENAKEMAEKNYQLCKQTYEKFYGEPLVYNLEK